MTERDAQLLAFYQRERIEDQLRYYRDRRDQFDRAVGQALALSAMLLGFSSAVGALAGADSGWTGLWTTLATVLPAVATALAAYTALYAFEQQSKIYGDAIRAVHAASRRNPPPGPGDGEPTGDAVTELVQRVETALRQEQSQWGQLTSDTQIAGPAEE